VLLRGHAAFFDNLSLDLGGFREWIARGAFARTLNADVLALVGHDPNLVIGRTTAGTVRLAEDRVGLATEIDPPDTAVARDLITLVERRELTSMSFGFKVLRDRWEPGRTPDDVIRTLLEVELFDVSAVSMPAYRATDLSVSRGTRAHIPSRRERLRLVEMELRSREDDMATREKAVAEQRGDDLRRLADEVRKTGRCITRYRSINGEMRVVSSVPAR
jgi:HK97 family phage prohead protease